jgi:hypothetical protein
MRARARLFGDGEQRMKFPEGWPPSYLPMTMVLLEDDTLPERVASVVLLRPSRREECLIVIPRRLVTDEKLAHSRGVLFVYRLTQRDDTGPVAFTLHSDNRLEVESEERGRRVSWYKPLVIHSSQDEVMSRELLARAAKVPTTEFLGFGRAKVLSAVQMEP